MVRRNWRERLKTMNGSAKFFKWVAGGLAILILVLVQIGISDVKEDIKQNTDSSGANSKRIDSLSMQMSRHLFKHDADRAELILQVAAIAEKLNVPVVVDTATAKRDAAAPEDSSR